jgi:hypothetical protein
MTDVKRGADGVSIPARDAVEWFVENESDRELDEEAVTQWEAWCAYAWNKTAYADIVHMRLQIRLLAAPTFASREDLLRDVLAEVGPES